MPRVRYILLLLPALFASTAFAGDTPKGNTAKENLQAFNDLVGSWRGTGQPGSTLKIKNGFWTETMDWSWRFKENDAWMVVRITDGQFYRKGELRYLPEKKQYELQLETVDKKPVTFTGELNVREQLIIHSTGKVSGTVRYGKVLIEEGGQLCGDIQMMSKNDSKPAALQAPRIAQS